jgi:hypothetical protein
VEQNRKAGQNPPRVVAPIEEEEEVMIGCERARMVFFVC